MAIPSSLTPALFLSFAITTSLGTSQNPTSAAYPVCYSTPMVILLPVRVDRYYRKPGPLAKPVHKRWSQDRHFRNRFYLQASFKRYPTRARLLQTAGRWPSELIAVTVVPICRNDLCLTALGDFDAAVIPSVMHS
jgi:hypothetical protein